MNYDKFVGNDGSDKATRAIRAKTARSDTPPLRRCSSRSPTSLIYAGDVVYYDKKPKVKTLADMRAKWHRQNNLPRMIALHAAAPGLLAQGRPRPPHQ